MRVLVLSLLGGLALGIWLAAPRQSALHADTDVATTADSGRFESAIFAGGCFWCVESDFDKVDGVVKTLSGYIGGHVPNVGYREVTAGNTGHREAVRIDFDPSRVSYDELLDVFWRSVDPTDAGGQFCDRGESYSTAIFTMDQQQKQLAEASRAALSASGVLKADVVTPVLDAGVFYPAETYHQDYHTKNPVRYKLYRTACGRDSRIAEVWSAASTN